MTVFKIRVWKEWTINANTKAEAESHVTSEIDTNGSSLFNLETQEAEFDADLI